MTQHRIGIEGNGFLTEQIKKSLRELPIDSAALAAVVTSTIEFANKLARDLPVYWPHETPQERQKVIALALLIRLVEIVESILILSAFGVRQELKTLFRVFLDAYFLIANVCSDPEFVAIYFRTDEPERLKLLNVAARQDHELFSAVREYASDEIRENLDKQIKDEQIQAFNSHLFANNVACGHIYDSMYRLSSPSVHSGPRCLAEYINADQEGNVLSIRHTGDEETTGSVLYDTEVFLLQALTGVCELFGLPHVDELGKLRASVEAAMTEAK